MTPRQAAPKIVMVAIEDLKPATYNPKTIDKDELKRLEGSINEFGFVDPIIANEHPGRENVVIGGHQRLKAAHRLALKRVPVRYVNEPEPRERMLNAALSNPHLQGKIDEPKLAVLLKEIQDMGHDATATGYTETQVNNLIATINAERAERKSSTEPRKGKPKTERGNLYTIGEHRLLCGDATRPEVVDRLMAGAQAHLVFTDPPYGVSYQDRRTGGDYEAFEAIVNDDKRDADLIRLLVDSLNNAIAHTTDDAPFYIWHGTNTRRDYEAALDYVGLEEIAYIMWAKDNFVLSGADYHSQYEPCFYAQKIGSDARWTGQRDQATLWTVARTDEEGKLVANLAQGIRVLDGDGNEIYIAPNAPRSKKIRKLQCKTGEEIHIATSTDESDVWQVRRDPIKSYETPTQKPTALAERAIRNSTKRGQSVLDLFAGSGSTMAAAEELGRRSFLMEKDTGTCDVITARAERLGLEVKLEETPAK